MNLASLDNLPSTGGFMSRAGVASQSSPPPSPSPSASHHRPSAHDPRDHTRDPSRTQPRRYVCDHNSAPPAHQYITTDKTNILIRALVLKRNKDELAGRAASGSGATGGPGSHPSRPGGVAAAAAAAAAAARPAEGGASAAAAIGKRPAPSGLERSSGGSGGSGGGGGGGGLGRSGGSTGLERASKRPATGGADAAAVAEVARLETLSVEELREFLAKKGQSGGGIDAAGKAALLQRAKLCVKSGGRR